MTKRFPAEVVALAKKSMVIGIKAGRRPHRVIAIWAVVVNGRIFARSWSRKKTGWQATLRTDPVGELHLGPRKHAFRASFTRSERIKDAVSAAYREKYHTPGSLRYVRDLSKKKSRDTTTEFSRR